MLKRSTLKLVFIIAVILIVLILGLRELIIYNQQRAEYEEKTYDSLADFSTVQEVAEYMDCEYIKEILSPNESFDLDIYLKFKYNLYTDGASNEEYFYRAAVLFAQVTGYKKVRLIDDSKELVIAIIGNSEAKKIIKLYINGNDNYYGNKDTIKALENYKQANITRIEVQSEILKNLIKKEWKTKEMDFGSQETTYDGYDIYFEEGLEVKKIGTKVFNIVLTDKYEENIINDIKTDTSFEDIVKKLGDPTYGNVNGSIIGYKSENMYIFFEKNRVSIYPLEKMGEEQAFLTLLESFRETADVKVFVSGVTDLWPNYDVYNYNEDTVDLQYSLKGIKIEINTQRDTGVIFYNNYNGSYISDLRSKTSDLPKYTYFEDKNLVYEKEQKNIYSDHNYYESIKSYKYLKGQIEIYNSNDEDTYLKYMKDSSKFIALGENLPRKLKIISVDGNFPPNETKDKVDDYLWVDDYNLAYSIKNKGIYIYNAETRETKTLTEGQNEFNLKKYENGILYYDDAYLIYGLLDIPINSYVWLDNMHLAYSIKNQGIYVLNIGTQEKSTVLEGPDEFNLIKYEAGILYYDNTDIFYVITD